MSEKIKILYVDKEENNLTAFRAYFRRSESFEITTSLTIEEILTTPSVFHVLVLDHGTLKDGGDAVCNYLKREGVNIVKIVVTAYRDITALESYLVSGELYECLYKPFDFEQLGKVIEKAYASHFK